MTVTIYFPAPPNLRVTHKQDFARACGLIGGAEQRKYIHFEIQDRDTDRTALNIPPAIAADFLSQGFEPQPGQFRARDCASCHSCVPIRVVLPLFNERSEHRRIQGKNRDLSIRLYHGLPANKAEYEDIYRGYRVKRFYHGSQRDYLDANDGLNADSYRLYPGMKVMRIDAREKQSQPQWLLGSLFFHVAEDVAYGSLFFYDMDRRDTNLGLAMVLHLAQYLKKRGFQYLYLGHWTRHASSFSWKDQLTPVDTMIDGEWQRHLSKATLRPLRQDRKDAYPVDRFKPK